MSRPTHKQTKCNNLLAIILVTRSRPGPKLVFHYPLDPVRYRDESGKQDDSEDVNSESDDEHDFDDETAGLGGDPARKDPTKWLLGHSVDSLEKLLCPGRWSEGKKFEISLGAVTFVGHPVYAGEDGSWGSRQGRKGKEREIPRLPLSSKSSVLTTLAEGTGVQDFQTGTEGEGVESLRLEDGMVPAVHDFTHMPDSLESGVGTASLGTSIGSMSTTSGLAAEQLGMFHVVFALDKSVEAADMLDPTRLHDEVAKKLGKALKHCQKQCNYVATESRKTTAIKHSRSKSVPATSTADLWAHLIASSELAWALSELYTSLKHNDIANLRMDGQALSLQIPASVTTHELDSLDLKTSTLLLLTPRSTLLRSTTDIDHDLAHFVRASTPTKSLHKHIALLGLPAQTLQQIAHHLLTYRAARLIPPLHPRNTYIMNPGAPSRARDIRAISVEYSKQFPALPRLERVLAMLGPQVNWRSLIPSTDHREAYMMILAWLVREELVVLVRSYGWLILPSSPKEEAGGAMKEDVSVVETGLILHPRSLASETVRVQMELVASRSRAAGYGVFADRLSELMECFDGRRALEELAARQGFKRAKVEDWLDWVEGEGLVRRVWYA
jgi:hypothetical protein